MTVVIDALKCFKRSVFDVTWEVGNIVEKFNEQKVL